MNWVKKSKGIWSKDGAALIEFALIVPFLMLILSGLFDFSLILIKRNALNIAVNAGVLYANANPKDVSGAGTKAAIQQATKITPLTITVSSFCGCIEGPPSTCNGPCADGSIPGRYFLIDAKTSVPLTTLLPLTNPFPIEFTATVRVQ